MLLQEDTTLALPSDQFERPVVVLTQFGVPTAVSSAMEAYMFLTDWPASHRDVVFSLALKGCLAAVRGDIETETAGALRFMGGKTRHPRTRRRSFHQQPARKLARRPITKDPAPSSTGPGARVGIMRLQRPTP